MKFFPINQAVLPAVFVLMTVLYSCKKESSSDQAQAPTEAESVVYAEESAQAEASFDDIEDVGRIAAEEEASASAPNGRLFLFLRLRERLGPCAVITVTPNDSTYPKTVTIDFPGNGCWCADGQHRKGTITLHFTGPIRRAGSVLTITLTDFYLNRAHIEGTKIISNLSANGAVHFTVRVVGGKVTFPTGRGYSYDGVKEVTQTDGIHTPNLIDDVYEIGGRSKTVFNNGVTILLNTESPLVKKFACRWISDGVVKIKINDRVLFLDYGAPSNGDCDNKALLTWGGGTRIVVLP
ncbi:MAG: hypothetical protein H7Y42_05415 [Chitinophagaceae bacterium]|nr:hypothetical protein [Chitinophagaceae bacterium]